MPTLTWDILLSLMIVGFCVFGFVLRKYKAGVLIIALLVSYTVTEAFSLSLFRQLQKLEIVDGQDELFLVKLFMFVGFSFLIFLEGEYLGYVDEQQNGGGWLGSVMGAFFGLLAGGITLISIYWFMSHGDKTMIVDRSGVMSALHDKEFFFFLPFPVFLAVSSLVKRFR